jgi:hypothetical protein
MVLKTGHLGKYIGNTLKVLKCSDGEGWSLFVAYMPPYTHRQRYINEDKIVSNTDNLRYLQFLHFYGFILVIDTIV